MVEARPKFDIVPKSLVRTADIQVIPSTSGGVKLSSGETKAVIIKAPSTNSGIIYVGASSGDTPYSGYGYILEAGDKETFEIDNLNKINVFATVSGDKISFCGLF